jgi:hypothetical protein
LQKWGFLFAIVGNLFCNSVLFNYATNSESEVEELVIRNPDVKIDSRGMIKKPGKKPGSASLYDLPLVRDIEQNYQDWVIRTLRQNGWRVHAERPAFSKKGYRTPIQGDPGFPDIIALHDEVNYCLVIENKSKKGTLSPDQEKWVIAFARIPGVKVLVLRPDEKEKIEKIAERRKDN